VHVMVILFPTDIPIVSAETVYESKMGAQLHEDSGLRLVAMFHSFQNRRIPSWNVSTTVRVFWIRLPEISDSRVSSERSGALPVFSLRVTGAVVHRIIRVHLSLHRDSIAIPRAIQANVASLSVSLSHRNQSRKFPIHREWVWWTLRYG
jgi:hypothetical protein